METPQGITVLGQGIVRTPVDRVELSIGVEVDRAEPGPAFQAAAGSVSAVLAVLADAGVDSRHVRTADLRLWPRMNFQDNREVIQSYLSGQRLFATLEGLAGMPRLLSDLATTGIEGVRFDGISFGTADPSAYLAQAREHAMDDARRKAVDYARMAERDLGQVLSVKEAAVGGAHEVVDLAFSPRSAKSMPVAAGEATVSVAVEVVFALL